MISKVHVTITAGVVGITAIICGVVALALTLGNGGSPVDALAVVGPFAALATGCVGVIGGVAVPTSAPSTPTL